MIQREEIIELIEANKKRLHKLKRQEAVFGLAADPSIDIEIERITDYLEALVAQLDALGDPIMPASDKDSQYQIALKWAETGKTANMTRFNLQGVDLRATDLAEAKLLLADLRSTNLYLATLDNADLRLAQLDEANLGKASLKKANLFEANLEGANLKEANLAGANLAGTNLRYAILIGASLEGANLKGANLEDTILTEAILTDALLEKTSLRNANLKGANLTNVSHLTSADLWNIKYDDHTIWPQST